MIQDPLVHHLRTLRRYMKDKRAGDARYELCWGIVRGKPCIRAARPGRRYCRTCREGQND